MRQWERDNNREVGSIQVYFDSGVRSGGDVLKALALGADLVFVGRPTLWGLASANQKGVTDVVTLLNEELEEAMKHCGVTSIEDLKRRDIVYKPNELLFAKMWAYTKYI